MSGIQMALLGSANPLRATAAPNPVSAIGAGPVITSPSATCTPEGGIAGYTYLWSRVSGDAGITITSPTAASTTFSKSMTPAATTTGDFKCTVTDSISGVADSNAITVNLERL